MASKATIIMRCVGQDKQNVYLKIIEQSSNIKRYFGEMRNSYIDKEFYLCGKTFYFCWDDSECSDLSVTYHTYQGWKHFSLVCHFEDYPVNLEHLSKFNEAYKNNLKIQFYFWSLGREKNQKMIYAIPKIIFKPFIYMLNEVVNGSKKVIEPTLEIPEQSPDLYIFPNERWLVSKDKSDS